MELLTPTPELALVIIIHKYVMLSQRRIQDAQQPLATPFSADFNLKKKQ